MDMKRPPAAFTALLTGAGAEDLAGNLAGAEGAVALASERTEDPIEEDDDVDNDDESDDVDDDDDEE